MNNRIQGVISDIVWVAIRVLGLVFVIKGMLPWLSYLALKVILRGVSAGEVLSGAFADRMNPLSDLIVLSLVPSLGFLLVGAYLLFRGETLHFILTRIPTGHEANEGQAQAEEGDDSRSETKEMKRLYRSFLNTIDDSASKTAKERHQEFRVWLENEGA